MADITSSDVDRLISSLDGLTTNLTRNMNGRGGYGSKSGGVNIKDLDKQAKETSKSVGFLGRTYQTYAKTLDGATTSAIGLHKSLGTVSGAFGTLESTLKTVSGGVLAGAIVASMQNSLKTYQELRTIGQDFGGSILKMQQAAASANLPLDEFAQAIKNNSTAVATLGTKNYFALNTALRSSLREFGMFGMRTADVNDLMAQYTETQRRNGLLTQISATQATTQLKNLALEATALATLTGKSRMELIKMSQETLQDPLVVARTQGMAAGAAIKFTENATKASLFLSSIPGKAGEVLNTMFKDTLGQEGSSLLTDGMKLFVDAGLGGVGALMDGLAKKVEEGTPEPEYLSQFYKQLLDQGRANRASLQLQARAGNQAAKQALEVINELEANKDKYTVESLRRAKIESERQEKITKVMSNFEEIVNGISGKLRGVFFNGLENMLAKFKDFEKTDAYQFLMSSLEDAGKVISNVFGELTVDSFKKVGTVLSGVATAGSYLIAIGAKIVEFLGNVFERLSKTIGATATAFTALAALIAVKYLRKKAEEAKDRKFVITGTAAGIQAGLRPYVAGNAIRVTENGFSMGDGPDRKGGRNRRNRRTRKGGIGKAADAVEQAAEKKGLLSRGWNATKNAASKAKAPGKHIGAKIGMGALLTYAGSSALQMLPESTPGKTTAVNTIDRAGTGAMWGTAIGGALGGIAGGVFGLGAGAVPGAIAGASLGNRLGLGLGAAYGALEANWDEIKKWTSTALDFTKTTAPNTPSSTDLKAKDQKIDDMTGMVKTMQNQQDEARKNNAELSKNIEKLISLQTESNAIAVAGTQALVGEQRRTNKNINDLGTGI